MQTEILTLEETSRVQPLCPVFGACGGCAYQDRDYREELQIKEAQWKELLSAKLSLDGAVFEPIVASPEPYHYRSRLDITLHRLRSGNFLFGFQVSGARKIIPIESCAIALKPISEFLPTLYREATEKLPQDYRVANLVIKTGEEGRVYWGGIGRRSLSMKEEDYLWTEIHGKRIFYSLDTFFQANLSMLPLLMQKVAELARLTHETLFFDLYGGVGLFGIYFAEQVKKVVLVEESAASIQMARFNANYHGLGNMEIEARKVEEALPNCPSAWTIGDIVAIVDPPRRGLSPEALAALAAQRDWRSLLYLSCNPESLVRDLAEFVQRGWKIKKMIPFDFFPKTYHLETLVCLTP